MDNLNNLIKVLECYPRVFIQIRNSPDPDAAASAFGIQYLIKTQNIDSTICCENLKGDINTKSLIEKIGMQIYTKDEIPDMNEEDGIMLVDSQKGDLNLTDFPGDEIAVIDHHLVKVKSNFEYTDIRTDVGACSSIVAEHFFKNGIEIPTNIATALLFGIKHNTRELTERVSELDIDIFYKLYKLSDIQLLRQIQFEQK